MGRMLLLLIVLVPLRLHAQQGGRSPMDPSQTLIGRQHPQDLRRDLQEDSSGDTRRRRWIIALSLFGMLNMAAVSLFQTGLIKKLPDPPLPRFDSAKVNSSDTAYRYGVPDGPVDLVMLGINILLAAAGGAGRAASLALAPILLAGKTGAEAAGALWYFRQMTKLDAWCIYCLLTAATHLAVFPLAWPEAWRALTGLLRR